MAKGKRARRRMRAREVFVVEGAMGAAEVPVVADASDPALDGEPGQVDSFGGEWPDLDAADALAPVGASAEPAPARASGPRLSIELDDEALRCAVADYLSSRLLPGASVDSVALEGGRWRAEVSLAAVGVDAPRAAPAFRAIGDALDEPESIDEVLEERRSRRTAAHEKMIAKRGGAGRLRDG